MYVCMYVCMHVRVCVCFTSYLIELKMGNTQTLSFDINIKKMRSKWHLCSKNVSER